MEPTLHTYELQEYAPDFGSHDYISHGYYTLSDALYTLKLMADNYREKHALRHEYRRSIHYVLPEGEQRRIVRIVYVPV